MFVDTQTDRMHTCCFGDMNPHKSGVLNVDFTDTLRYLLTCILLKRIFIAFLGFSKRPLPLKGQKPV